VSISGSVRFSSKKITKPILKKKTETEPKPVQIDQFRFGLVRLIKEKNWKNQFIFFGFFMTFDGVI